MNILKRPERFYIFIFLNKRKFLFCSKETFVFGLQCKNQTFIFPVLLKRDKFQRKVRLNFCIN